MISLANKLSLGAVQFGIKYGIANKTGQVDRETVAAILRKAKESGVNTIDTAISYGQSEEVLGWVGVKNWKVITKLPEVPEGCVNITKWVRNSIENSLTRLKVEYLEGVLLHRPIQLLDADKKSLWIALTQLKKEGLVGKIGFSIYTPEELDRLWGKYKPDIVQVPYNIFDRRIKTSGWLQRMSSSNVEVHIRSIFLQGLLLIDKTQRPKQFNNWSALWNYWDCWLKMNKITPLQAALAFAFSEDSVKRIVVGMDSELHLKEILSALKVNITNFPEELSVTDQKLINPSQWNL
jgi:aryl-alcohol dehydrogenase-like predicted oxidoreductase